ncbi:MAG: Transcriptional regulator CtsR [Firmicutes bacterium]|nr:Transcriptional regulator CtsR [Bacillota bacterium]MDI6706464.1 CtsR family transcriptional regulator [Bacillota bacterium]
MFRLSDIIEEFIKELMRGTGADTLEIQRNELAEHFNCAPSQINYVLSTRFSIDKGYYIESRRGGGGYIRIQKLEIARKPYLSHLIFEHIGDSLTQMDALRVLKNLEEKNIISSRERAIMEAAVNDKSINVFSPPKDAVRANIMKSMLSTLIRE